MTGSRYSTSRRKACDQCCRAKVKCVPGEGGCTRCRRRGENCRDTPSTFLTEPARRTHPRGSLGVPKSPIAVSISNSASCRIPATNGELELGVSSERPSILSSTSSHGSGGHILLQSISSHQPAFDIHQSLKTSPSTNSDENGQICFDGLESDLVCPINADDIQNRWLSAYIPTPDQTIKQYPNNVVSFMSRMFKSYSASTIKGRGLPPFVHSVQMTTPNTCLPLKTCLSMVRLLEKSFPGSQDVAVSTIQHEMRKLYPVSAKCDSITLLSIFQAYLTYTMVLFFMIEDLSRSFLRQSMMTIQDLACASSRQGLVCLAEQQLSRPKWEAWIMSEAKRRTLYTMCMFDSILLSQENLPNYLSIELKGLPAPSSKYLWQPHSRREWKIHYNLHLAEWPEQSLRIDELWPLSPALDKASIKERSRRTDQWLEGVDEFGTMLFAVTSCTHGT